MPAPTFALTPAAYAYRPLRPRDPMLVGWDVFALQTALNAFAAGLAEDGVLGRRTAQAIRDYQDNTDLTSDGVAGTATQKHLALRIMRRACADYTVPTKLEYGQLERESGFILGNQSAMRDDDGDGDLDSADLGVAQRNSSYLFARSQGFDVPDSIYTLCRQVRDYHTKYRQMGVDDPRAWALAAGSWNAPAWTDTLAEGKQLASAAQRLHIETYIAHVTAYYL
jgi:hypothetical protein